MVLNSRQRITCYCWLQLDEHHQEVGRDLFTKLVYTHTESVWCFWYCILFPSRVEFMLIWTTSSEVKLRSTLLRLYTSNDFSITLGSYCYSMFKLRVTQVNLVTILATIKYTSHPHSESSTSYCTLKPQLMTRTNTFIQYQQLPHCCMRVCTCIYVCVCHTTDHVSHAPLTHTYTETNELTM